MADAQRGQFVIDCKSGEAADIIYGLVHDETLFRPELDLANAHPKEFDNEHIFPLDMFINSDYMLKLNREEFVKELKRLFDEDKIGYAQVVVATDIHAHLTPFCWRSEDEIKYTNSDFYQQPLAHLCELHTI